MVILFMSSIFLVSSLQLYCGDHPKLHKPAPPPIVIPPSSQAKSLQRPPTFIKHSISGDHLALLAKMPNFRAVGSPIDIISSSPFIWVQDPTNPSCLLHVSIEQRPKEIGYHYKIDSCSGQIIIVKDNEPTPPCALSPTELFMMQKGLSSPQSPSRSVVAKTS